MEDQTEINIAIRHWLVRELELDPTPPAEKYTDSGDYTYAMSA